MKYLFVLFFPFFLFSQITPPVILWEHTYTETGLGGGTSLLKTNNNEFLLASGYGGSNSSIIKFDTEGDFIWEQNLISSFNYFGASNQNITKGQDNLYYTLANNCENNQQISIQQFDDNGSLLENWCLPINYFPTNSCIIATNDGGLLISLQHTLIKLNAQKEIQWTVEVHPENTFTNLIETSDGHYLAVGAGYANRDEPEENLLGSCYFIKFDSNGNIMWEKNFGAVNAFPALEYIASVSELPNGNYLLNCSTDGDVENGNSCLNVWMVTTDTNGNIVNNLTVNPIGTNGGTGISKILLEPEGGYVVSIYNNCSGPTWPATIVFRLVKVSATNTIVWDASFTSGTIHDIERTTEGDYIAVGVDNNPSVFGFGSLKTMKIGWEPLSTPSFENSVSIYPNPAQDYIMVKNNFTENQTVVIYNVAGQTIMKQEINQNENQLDVAKLAKGIYFVHLPESNTTLKWIKG